jgi:hypothetical protein
MPHSHSEKGKSTSHISISVRAVAVQLWKLSAMVSVEVAVEMPSRTLKVAYSFADYHDMVVYFIGLFSPLPLSITEQML